MPLHQINVSPAESVKNEAFSDRQGVGGRCESQLSSESSGSQGVEICRICHCEGDADAGLIAPCYCSGSLRFVHQLCLQQWIKSSNTKSCELCRFQFIMHTKTKPFTEWEPLEMNGFERRKLVCAVMFHAVALTCVVWSLYVLIDRTAEEIRQGLLEWPFWTKLIVVAIGFTGGVVFMYIQCKAYMQVCQRWKAYNRVIYVQNAPEKQGSLSMSGGGVLSAGPRRECDCSTGAEQASIDLTGVRNVHIYFKDEVEGAGGVGGAGPAPVPTTATTAPPTSDPMWHIKIGKAPLSSDSAPTLRNNETENGGCGADSREESVARSPADPSLLKLQIKKAEIVIQFGQKSSSATVATEGCGESGPTVPDKDTSVNIKIDDKESEPIVIDLVKKGTAPLDGAEIRLGFKGADESLRGVTLLDVPEEEPRMTTSEEGLLEHRVNVVEADGLLERHPTPDYHSGTDSGSQSPLLQAKNLD